jgi:hypothetical protein
MAYSANAPFRKGRATPMRNVMLTEQRAAIIERRAHPA